MGLPQIGKTTNQRVYHAAGESLASNEHSTTVKGRSSASPKLRVKEEATQWLIQDFESGGSNFRNSGQSCQYFVTLHRPTFYMKRFKSICKLKFAKVGLRLYIY